MPLKTKTPPALSQTSQQPPSLSEERILRVNPEIDRRLDAFMQANDRMTEYYAKLVKENPDRAVRAFMLTKMFKHEAQLRVTERQAPQAKEWLDQQEPSIKQRIMDRLQKINPFYREKALVREIAREKTRIDFTPKQSLGQGMSV
jgi:ribosomal protein L13E